MIDIAFHYALLVGGIAIGIIFPTAFARYIRVARDPLHWRHRAEDLWQLLDDIDTLDDACREHDELFRARTRAVLKKRHQILESLDGYTLSVPVERRR